MATVVAIAVRSSDGFTPNAKPAMSECTEKSAANKYGRSELLTSHCTCSQRCRKSVAKGSGTLGAHLHSHAPFSREHDVLTDRRVWMLTTTDAVCLGCFVVLTRRFVFVVKRIAAHTGFAHQLSMRVQSEGRTDMH